LKQKKGPVWILPAVGAALVANLMLLGIVSFLVKERRPPQDMTDPVGVNLVELAAPEAPKEEKLEEPPPPKPQQLDDFTPDLVRPDLGGPSDLFDGIAIDLGGMGGGDMKEEFVFEAYELDQPPQPVAKIPPVYPYKAREQGIEGAVQVKLLVNSDGTVGQVQILDARPKGLFEESVMNAVPKWKFNPGVIEGQPVTAWVVTTLRFTLDSD
jgi:protein TonB